MAVKIDEVLAPDWWSWCLLVAGNTAPRLRVANQGGTDHQFPVTTRTIQRSKARRALWPFGCGPCGACCLGSRRRCTNCHRPAGCRCRCLKNCNFTVSVAQWCGAAGGKNGRSPKNGCSPKTSSCCSSCSSGSSSASMHGKGTRASDSSDASPRILPHVLQRKAVPQLHAGIGDWACKGEAR